MERGNAVDYGVGTALMNDQSAGDAVTLALQYNDTAMAGEVTHERERIPAIAGRFMSAIEGLGKPVHYQHTSERTFPGLRLPVGGTTDLEWDGLCLDLKSKANCPRRIGERELRDVRQAAVYAKLTGKKAVLLYASHANQLWYELTAEDMERGWNDMYDAFRRIERLDDLFTTPAMAMHYIPFDPGAFWNADEVAQVRKAWQQGVVASELI